MLGVLSWALIALSVSAYVGFFALLCLCAVSYWAWRSVRLALRINQISHSGNQLKLTLNWQGTADSSLPTQALWLSFHRLGPLAWLKLGLLSEGAERLSGQTTIFIWQGTNSKDSLQVSDSLREWARRWHTLSHMSDAPDFLPNN